MDEKWIAKERERAQKEREREERGKKTQMSTLAFLHNCILRKLFKLFLQRTRLRFKRVRRYRVSDEPRHIWITFVCQKNADVILIVLTSADGCFISEGHESGREM